MKRLGILSLLLALGQAARGQYAPPAPMPPDDATRKQIESRTDELRKVVERMRAAGVKDPFLADIEIYQRAAEMILKHGEFYGKDAGKWTLDVLDRGFLRASQQLRGESPWLNTPGFSTVRAYRSGVDGSLQPYAVTLPASFGKEKGKKWRLDVVLHGRSPTLTEVSFLHSFAEKPAPKDQNFVRIDIYGRGNNAYRWAGESDVSEAVDHYLTIERLLGRGDMLDPQRFVLRGFSMGGAGTWHLGLHRPDRWCVLGPGAGFTTTHGYVKDLPEKLPYYVEDCLRVYDAVDYAENAFDVPVVAYSGSDDPQKAAAQNIEDALKQTDIKMTHLIAPGLKHEFPAEWQKKAEAEYAKYVEKGRAEYPNHVRFVTYTLKYPSCDWVDIFALERHYQRALVDAEAGEKGYKVRTTNVRGLELRMPAGATRGTVPVTIDGQEVTARKVESGGSINVFLEKRDGKWVSVLPEWVLTSRMRTPQKTAALQGPIDDAFTGPFLCVIATKEPWNAATLEYADAEVKRFGDMWSKYFRGTLPVKRDDEVTSEDIATKHLILFGDPGSNTLIAQVLPGLPFRWTKEKINWDGKDYDAADHVPVLIYPSPLNPERYVVLNSGHTFRAADCQGTNALLYPRLGDYALLRTHADRKDPTLVQAGLFDDFWRMTKEK
jgi:pimeloyl-ACP methyl ester carboxylesterase